MPDSSLGPTGLSRTRRHSRFTCGPTGIAGLSDNDDLEFMESMRRRGEQQAYSFLDRQWAKYRGRRKDCWAMCFYVAGKILSTMKFARRNSPVKMFKHDKKWCKGIEHNEAIDRYKTGFGDKLSSGSWWSIKGPSKVFQLIHRCLS